MQVSAYAAFSPDQDLGPATIERRAVGAQDVLIEIDYCGVCHSDIHIVRGEWSKPVYPLVPGHEIIGHVLETGDDVSGFKMGDLVGVGCMVDSCRTARPATRSRTILREGLYRHL